MSEPTTRPGEYAKIKAIAGDDPRWERLLTDVAVLLERSEQTQNWQRGTDEWRALHDRADATSFAELRADITALKSNERGIRSGVNDYEDVKAQAMGAKKLFVGTVAVVGAIGAVLLSLKGIKEAWLFLVDWVRT